MVYVDDNTQGDDTVIVAVVTLDREEVAESFGDNPSAKEVEAAVWKEVDKLNDSQPFFKKIKKITFRKRDFVKNTSSKIIRFEEDNKKA